MTVISEHTHCLAHFTSWLLPGELTPSQTHLHSLRALLVPSKKSQQKLGELSHNEEIVQKIYVEQKDHAFVI